MLCHALIFLLFPLVSSDFWPLYCLSIIYLELLITPLVSSDFWSLKQQSADKHVATKRKRQPIQWPRWKDRQHNDQEIKIRQYNDQEEKTDNTMTKSKRQIIQWRRGKDRQYNDQVEKTDNVFSSWSLYCLSVPLGYCIVLSFPLGHYIVCLLLLVIVLSVFSFWSLYCLSFTFGHGIVCLFLLVIVLFIFTSWSLWMTKRKRQTIQWPKVKDK
jgi:lipopolysaccharide export LptBFGC system permease protein LptF